MRATRVRKHKNNSEISFITNQFNSDKVNILDFGAGWGHLLYSGDKSKFSPYALEMSKHRKKYIANFIKKSKKATNEFMFSHKL